MRLQSLAVIAASGAAIYLVYKGSKLGGGLADAAGAVGEFVSKPNPISETTQNAVRTVTGNENWYLSDAFAWMTGLSKKEAEYTADTELPGAPLALPTTAK